jgi:hypothetical protein
MTKPLVTATVSRLIPTEQGRVMVVVRAVAAVAASGVSAGAVSVLVATPILRC